MEEVLLRIFDREDFRRISARIRAGDAVRQRPARRPPGRRDRQPPRISEDPEGPASAASSTPNPRAKWLTSSNRPSARGRPSFTCRTSPVSWSGSKRRAQASSAPARRWWKRCRAPPCPRSSSRINHASGAGYYAMAGQGFDPNFTFSWPTARIGVMEGDSAVQALFSVELEKLKATRPGDAARIWRKRSPAPAPITSDGSMPERRRPRSCRCADRSAGNPRSPADAGAWKLALAAPPRAHAGQLLWSPI